MALLSLVTCFAASCAAFASAAAASVRAFLRASRAFWSASRSVLAVLAASGAIAFDFSPSLLIAPSDDSAIVAVCVSNILFRSGRIT
ncbi:hypothetical protein G3N99_15230 [Burkholderia sp. Ac-20392]|nr:hypothetical protein [Burkholderia sp. Ac-20392]